MHKDEVAYPFLPEASVLCDWEISTDMLCSQIALAVELLPHDTSHSSDLKDVLRKLQEIVYHMNGSVRGRCAILESDLQWMHGLYQDLQSQNSLPPQSPFVLPAGVPAAAQLHVTRCQAKQCVRWLYRIQAEGKVVPELILRAAGLIANLLFALALQTNRVFQRAEIPFVTRSYGKA